MFPKIIFVIGIIFCNGVMSNQVASWEFGRLDVWVVDFWSFFLLSGFANKRMRLLQECFWLWCEIGVWGNMNISLKTSSWFLTSEIDTKHWFSREFESQLVEQKKARCARFRTWTDEAPLQCALRVQTGGGTHVPVIWRTVPSHDICSPGICGTRTCTRAEG